MTSMFTSLWIKLVNIIIACEHIYAYHDSQTNYKTSYSTIIMQMQLNFFEETETFHWWKLIPREWNIVKWNSCIFLPYHLSIIFTVKCPYNLSGLKITKSKTHYLIFFFSVFSLCLYQHELTFHSNFNTFQIKYRIRSNI